MLWLFIFKTHHVGLARFLWERPCVAMGGEAPPELQLRSMSRRGRFAALSRHKAAPTMTALAAWVMQRFDYVCLGVLACLLHRGEAAGFSVATNLA